MCKNYTLFATFTYRSMNPLRKRILIFLLFLVPLGFFTKAEKIHHLPWISNHLGGSFYVIFWILVVQFLFPSARPFKISLWVLIATSAIECTQLLSHPLLEIIRANFMGRTLIGNSFNGVDFLYYILGAVVGYYLLKIRNTSDS